MRRRSENPEEADQARLEGVPARAREELPHILDAHAAALRTDFTSSRPRKSPVSTLPRGNELLPAHPPLFAPFSGL